MGGYWQEEAGSSGILNFQERKGIREKLAL
jgi:hypothetical protein